MKKNLFFAVAVVSATLSLSSCKKEAKPVEEPVATEQPAAINSVDQALDEYDKLMDEYIVFMKDVKAGKADVTKMQEWTTKTQEIAAKFSDTKSYSPAQIERLNKIAQKVADALK